MSSTLTSRWSTSLYIGGDESRRDAEDDTPAATARGIGTTKPDAELGAYSRAMRREQAIRFGIVMVSRCAVGKCNIMLWGEGVNGVISDDDDVVCMQ